MLWKVSVLPDGVKRLTQKGRGISEFEDSPGLQSEFQDSQGHTEKPCLKKLNQTKLPPPKKEGAMAGTVWHSPDAGAWSHGHSHVLMTKCLRGTGILGAIFVMQFETNHLQMKIEIKGHSGSSGRCHGRSESSLRE